jgi:hypothetical protein
MTAKLIAPPKPTVSASEQVISDFRSGSKFGKELVGDGSLGRLGGDKDLKSIINQKRRLSQGLTGSEVAGQRSVAENAINSSTEQARRRLASAQARAGVRGGTAANQQSQIIGQGLQAQQQFQQGLIQNNRNAQLQGLNSLEGTVNNVRQFDLSQQAKEKFAQLSTGFNIAGLGSTERGAAAQSDAAKFAASNSGKK